MKKIILSFVLSVIISLFCIESKAQFTFSVSPGFQFNGASFGYKINKFVPLIGLQVLSASTNLNEKGMRYDYDLGDIVSYEDKYKLSGTIYMPTIGVKYFFIETNKLKSYGTISYTKFFLSAKIEDDDFVSEDLKNEIKNIRLYGGQLGFGTEYFFDDNFSLGGEFGIRLLKLKYKTEIDDEVYNPDIGDYIPTTTTYDYKFNFNPTYVKISLNFYFGGK